MVPLVPGLRACHVAPVIRHLIGATTPTQPSPIKGEG